MLLTINPTRLRHFFLKVFVSCLISTTSYGEMDVTFSPDSDIQKLLIDSIAGCSSHIDLAISNLGSGELIQTLTDARGRGVEIRMVVDYQSARPKSSLVTHLKEEGLQIRALKGKAGGQMNNNFAIFDDKLLITGTYDWTNQAPKYSYEDVVITDDPSIIDLYRREFERLHAAEDHLAWTDSEPRPTKRTVEPEVQIKAPKGKIPSPKDMPFPELARGDREFIDVTIDELDALFDPQSTLSNKEKDARWQQYEGKYVQWNNAIVHKGLSHFDFYKLRLSSEIGGEAEVVVAFKPEYQPLLAQLREGDVIAYTARLDKRKGLGMLYRLDDGDILGRLIKKAPEQ